MNSVKTGNLITVKRKEHNLTQEQLADKLGVSNKTVSKWETGKCLPDYAVVESLCGELGISVSELLSGEVCVKEKEIQTAEDNSLQALKRIQTLEGVNKTLIGLVLIVLGIALLALSQTSGGSDLRDFISGLMLGLSISTILVGVFVCATQFSKKQ